MSVNTAHAENGVLIHAGEYILLHSDGVTMDFSGQDNPLFKGSKQGRIYLTSHRMIYNSKKLTDAMLSFSAPFIALSDVELEQPVFGANYIKGKVRAQPNGNFVGEVKFKLHFKAGGAIEYGQALLRAASTIQSNIRNGRYTDDPPPYTPSGAWHEAPPPAYQPPPGYYGWLPQHDAFSGPAPNSVFMSDNPPPYPGIGGPPPYNAQPQQPGYNPQAGFNPQPGFNPQQGFNPQPDYNPQSAHNPQPGYNSQQQSNDAPSWNGFSAPPAEQPNHPPHQQGWGGGFQPQPGHHSAWGGGGGYQPQPPPYGATGGGFAMPPGAGQQPAGGFQGYPQPGGYAYPPGHAAGGAAAGAMGFSAPSANSKEAEALASAFNTPYNQRGNQPGPSDMPPSYNDLPPNYNDSTRKNQ